MVKITPPATPTITDKAIDAIVLRYAIDRSKPFIIGRRGHWRDTMGEKGRNDLGIYDDAIFIITPTGNAGFIANTDPSRYRKGYGYTESKKGMAHLDPGCYDYKRGLHRKSYMALVQAGKVTVTRDGNPDYKDTGMFGINIHRGSLRHTSSLGCQTIYPPMWDLFYSTVDKLMNKHKIDVIKYCLVEGQG